MVILKDSLDNPTLDMSNRSTIKDVLHYSLTLVLVVEMYWVIWKQDLQL